ncbi:MAG: septal ring lytic transglycosylase RlpA family protein [Hyphomicrobiaceae bacterium]
MSIITHFGARLGLRAITPTAAMAVATITLGTGAVFTSSQADAKTPGARYCFARACHRVMTLAETRAAVGKSTTAITSFYDDCRRDRYNPCGLTSSGEAYRPGESNSAASPIYPDGTVVLVRNPQNGESAIVRINNAGPYWGNRTLDLSRAAGVKLGLAGVGVAKVELIVLRAPTAHESRYRKGRIYPRLPGHVGPFASIGEAQVFAALKLDLPDAISEGMIAVAHADTQVTPVSPVGYEPITGSPPERRLPAEVIRVSELQPAAATAGQAKRVAAQTVASAWSAPSLVVRATEIRGASLLIPPAGETTRVISERASIVGALRVGDFDRRGRSLLGVVAAGSGADDPAATQEPASLAAVSADDAALGGADALALERLPPLATRGERGWYRRATAAVTHVVPFAPASLTTRQTRIAHWAALRIASLSPEGDRVRDTANRSEQDEATLQPDDDRLRRITRPPARARSDEFYGIAA